MATKDFAASNGLGNLERLPPEVRTDIFKRLLPDDFEQTYDIERSQFICSPKESSPKPQHLHVSKQFRDEVLAASNLDGHHKIEIGLRKLKINFIADQKVSRTTSILAAKVITSCKMLEFTIVRPSPRSVTGFAQMRSNVHNIIEEINKHSPCQILPKITVRLEFLQDIDHELFCGSNDFSLLMGPFYRLAKRARTAMMYRASGDMIFSPRIEEQCDLIEDSIGGAAKKIRGTVEDPINIMRYQQCMLEIKLPLIFRCASMETTLNTREKEWVMQRSFRRVTGACDGLKKWYSEFAPEQMPEWLSKVEALAQNNRICDDNKELEKEILGNHDKMDFKYWVSGHDKVRTPFWDEHVGAHLQVFNGSDGA